MKIPMLAVRISVSIMCVYVRVGVYGNVIISVFENTVTRIIMFDY